MRVEKLLKRLRREFIKVNLIQASLDAITLFMVLNLVSFLFNISLISESWNLRALAGFSFLFFFANWLYRSRKYRLEIYEEQNPELQEILRTARDNLEVQNIVSQAMFDDLMERARYVTSESIIPGKQIIQKIVVIGILSFLTVLSGLGDIQLQADSKEFLSQLNPDELLEGEDDGVLKNSSEIFGEEKDLGDVSTALDINITGEGSGEEAERIGRGEEEEFVFEAAEPERIEDAELAKQYSLAIRDMQ